MKRSKEQTQQTIQFIRDNQHLSLSEIARQNGISREAVRKLVQRHELMNYPRRYDVLPQSDRTAIFTDLLVGMSREAVVTKYNTTAGTVSRIYEEVTKYRKSVKSDRIKEELQKPDRDTDVVIAKRCDTCPSVVAKVRKEMGIPRLPRNKMLIGARDAIRQYLATNPKATISQLATHAGVSDAEVAIIRWEIGATPLPIDEVVRVKIIHDLQKPDRDTDAVIAMMYGVNPMAVGALRRSLNIPALSSRRGRYSTTEVRAMRKAGKVTLS